jgi:hypothetical protein
VSTLRTAFRVAECYSNDELHNALGVGNAGGVRSSVRADGETKWLVVMTSVPNARQAKENPYHDRIEGDILVYTGAGREGDQTLAGANKRIPPQLSVPFPIYGFIIVSSRVPAKSDWYAETAAFFQHRGLELCWFDSRCLPTRYSSATHTQHST